MISWMIIVVQKPEEVSNLIFFLFHKKEQITKNK